MGDANIIDITETLCIRLALRPKLIDAINYESVKGSLLGRVCESIVKGVKPLIPEYIKDHYPEFSTEQLIKMYDNFMINGKILAKIDTIAEDMKRKQFAEHNADVSIQIPRVKSDSPICMNAIKKEMVASGTILKGIQTGFKALDEILGTIYNGSLVVIGARPGVGKTTLALNMAMRNAAAYKNKNVLFLSLEMSPDFITNKAYCMKVGKPLKKGLMEVMGDEDLYDNFYILKRGGVDSIEDFLNNNVCSSVFIDYIQYMETNNNGNNNGYTRYLDVTDNVIKIKKLADKYKVPVFALAQLSRSVEVRPDKKLSMSDLRDSGYIEQTADIIMLLNPDDRIPGIIKLQIEKNRYGRTGSVDLLFKKEYGRFYDHKIVKPSYYSSKY